MKLSDIFSFHLRPYGSNKTSVFLLPFHFNIIPLFHSSEHLLVIRADLFQSQRSPPEGLLGWSRSSSENFTACQSETINSVEWSLSFPVRGLCQTQQVISFLNCWRTRCFDGIKENIPITYSHIYVNKVTISWSSYHIFLT